MAMAVLLLRIYPRLRLYETTFDDIKFDSDYFIPVINKHCKGVRAIVVD